MADYTNEKPLTIRQVTNRKNLTMQLSPLLKQKPITQIK